MISIEEFCGKHSACSDGRSWAMENCTDMQDAWGKLKPDWLVWVATRYGVLSDKELRLFAVFCARSVQHLLTDQRSIDAIDVAERYAYGEASSEELLMAMDAAWDAARAAGDAWSAWSARAARGAVSSASAAMDAANAAAMDASAAMDAANAAARAASAAWDDASAAMDAAMDAQAKWLRENTKPNFGDV